MPQLRMQRMKTAFCERLGIELPIIQAPMGGAVGPALAAAVSNAGGLGMLTPWHMNIEAARRQIRETRALTARPFGVNLILEFPQEERLVACLDESVPVISFFWRDPAALVPRAKASGAIVLHTVGSAADAKRAVDCGVDIVVAQGWEANGPTAIFSFSAVFAGVRVDPDLGLVRLNRFVGAYDAGRSSILRQREARRSAASSGAWAKRSWSNQRSIRRRANSSTATTPATSSQPVPIFRSSMSCS
jgi:Nitronate monooxygenase